MTPPDDFPGDMHNHPFDDSDADVVFGSSPGSDPVPEELRDISELVNAARRTGSADELVDEEAIVARITAAIGGQVVQPDDNSLSSTGAAHERIPVLSKFRTMKVAAATTAMVVLGATAAAAATGSLPSPGPGSHKRAAVAVPAQAKVALAAKHAAPVAKARHHKANKNSAKKHHSSTRHRTLGVVASVNGVSDPNTCGIAGTDGSFTLNGRHDKVFTVNVVAATKYRIKDATDPSFANVCVGSLALVKGSVADLVVTATKVVVLPPKPVHEKKGAFGIVASVNGVSDEGTCGTAGAAGTFALNGHHDKVFTVNVDTATTYEGKDITDPSFAQVCVGVAALAKGTVVDTTVTATTVVIAPKRHDHKHKRHHRHGVFGTVASVNGVTSAGTCGTAGVDGSFTLDGWKDKIYTVNVNGETKFYAKDVDDASFANICVGGKVGAKGEKTDTTVAATVAFVLPEHDGRHDGDRNGSGNKVYNGVNNDDDRKGQWNDGGKRKHHDNGDDHKRGDNDGKRHGDNDGRGKRDS